MLDYTYDAIGNLISVTDTINGVTSRVKEFTLGFPFLVRIPLQLLYLNTLRIRFFTHCIRADVTDDTGLIEMLKLNINYFKSKPVNILKITILLAGGYLGNLFYPEIVISF